jgi:zinc/manganese transport system substrate-binding protein
MPRPTRTPIALRRWGARAALAIALVTACAQAEPVRIVAAEGFYGDIARQIGGEHVAVVSIVESADQDPHEFEAAPATARAIAQANLVVYNGAGYDPWVGRLLSATSSTRREAIDVAVLAGRKPGDNPHLWYDVATVAAFARDLASKLGRIDPAHADDYRRREGAFEDSLDRIRSRIVGMRQRYAGTPVTATEPVFQYMAEALGLAMRNARFQIAIMNGTEPGARSLAAFEDDLRSRRVKALLYNVQTGERLAQRLRELAEQSGVPVVEVSETQPPGTTYQQWMLAQLDALDRALAAP